MKKVFTLVLFSLGAIHSWAAPMNYFAAPTKAPTNFVAASIDGDRINLSWKNGDGAKRIIIARKEAAVTYLPVNGVSYNASAAFGAGNEVATGEFVVYNGNNNSTSVTNLQPGTQYFFSIFEYNGTGATIEYLTALTTTSGYTISAPTGQPSNLVASNIIGNSFQLSWTNPPSGSAGNGRIVIGREGAPVNVNPQDLVDYNANLQFGSGSEIGNGNFVLAKTSTASITVQNLKPATTYHFAIFEFKGSNGLVFNIVNAPTIQVTTLPGPTINSSSPSFTNVEGNSLKFSFTKGNGARRIVVARAGSPVSGLPENGMSYTPGSTFGTGTEIEPGEYVVANGAVEGITVTGLSKATTYHFAVFEYDGSGTSTYYLNTAPLTASRSTVATPTTQASNVAVTNLSNSSATINWSSGDGIRRLIIMRKDAPVNVTPAEFTQYGMSVHFGSGTHMGSGNYVVYNGTGNTATVQSLTAGATYHFVIYEFNGSTAPVYLMSNPPTSQFTTGQSPTQGSTGFELNYVEGNRLTFNWTKGNGSRRIAVLKAGSEVMGQPQDGITYTAQASFGAGSEIGPGEYVIMDNTSNQITVTNLSPGTAYHLAVFEYNVVNNQPYYLSTPGRFSGTTVAEPTQGSTGLQFSHVTGNSMKLTWTKGNGGRRIVLVKAGSPVDVVPSNFISYSDNITFGNGAQIGNGNYVVYSGTNSSTTIQGLLTGVTYHVAIFEYNGISFPVYFGGGVLRGSQQTGERPSVPSGNLVFSSVEGNKMNIRWTAGNGTRRILVGRAGSPVTALPEDGVDYSSSLNFGSGSEILPGQFVLSDGTLTEANITNLLPATTYHFAVFEYDGTGANTRYLTSAFGNASQATLSAPQTGPTNILFSSIGTTSATINWTSAVADKHLVVIRKGAPVSALPQQLVSYSASSHYGQSGALMSPEHYVLFNGSASNANVTALQPGTTYHVAVFAFNGNTNPMYNLLQVATASFTTLGPPSDPASAVQVRTTGNGSSVNISWSNGSGQRRLVLMKQASAVDALPIDNTTYTANNFFGSGQEIGNGNFVVYNGMDDKVTVNNLRKDQLYFIAVFEYNQFSTGPVYLTANYAEGQFSGAILPVKLGSWQGASQAGSNLLQWTTVQEINAAEFVIERSFNGNDFHVIGRVAARGNSNSLQSYRFEDKNPLTVSYYRLRMVDQNGSSEYSAVIRLQIVMENSLALFPTITSSMLQLNIKVPERTNALVRVIDFSGRTVMQQYQKIEAGIVTTTVDVSRLLKGTYLLEMQLGERKFTEKFIKQ